MAKPVKKILQETYDKLKQVVEKLTGAANQQKKPSLVLQPVRNKKY